jgi:thymidylate synthase (FAD)
MSDEFYVPNLLRAQSSTNRQGSSKESIRMISLGFEESPDGIKEVLTNPIKMIKDFCDEAYATYQHLIENNVARELARAVLPVNTYTEFYWTVDLWNLMHFLRLRLDGHAQKEIQLYGQAIFDLLLEECDLEMSLEAFQDYVLDAPNITKFELQILKEALAQLESFSISPLKTKEIIQQLIDNNSQMSKREKDETKLFQLLELKDD